MADDFQTKCRDVETMRERVKLITAPELNPTEMVEIYNTWAPNYDHDMNMTGPYAPPRIGADAVAELIGGVNKDARILDAATGTGLAALHLHEKGFRNLDGLDSSKAMLEEAKKKGIFKKLICDFMGPNVLEIEKGYYDVVVTVGSFAANSYAKHDCFPEMIRIIKPGGYFVAVMPEYCLESVPAYRGILEPAMQTFEKEGKWRLLRRESFSHSYREHPALLFVFQIL